MTETRGLKSLQTLQSAFAVLILKVSNNQVSKEFSRKLGNVIAVRVRNL
jgi:hypothetical protein